MLPKKPSPPHPCVMSLKAFPAPFGATRKAFAGHLGWTCARQNGTICGRRNIGADFALTPGEALETGSEVWLKLQWDRDLWHAMDFHR